MDYEFRRDKSSGALLAEFAMGQEVLGFWLVEELADNEDKYKQICLVIDQLHSHQIKSWYLTGKAISIELDTDQARVFANDLENDQELELEDAMSIYDGESESFCGLEDFYLVLQHWHNFINKH